jgi:hypothetical protein
MQRDRFRPRRLRALSSRLGGARPVPQDEIVGGIELTQRIPEIGQHHVRGRAERSPRKAVLKEFKQAPQHIIVSFAIKP